MKSLLITLLAAALSLSASFGQKPAAPSTPSTPAAPTAEQAKKVLEAAHRKAEAALGAKPTTGASATTASTPQPLNFSNVPVPAPKVFPKNSPPKSTGDMTIDANSLTITPDDDKAIFRGRVRLRSLAKDIDCEELEIFFKSGTLKKADGTEDKAAPAPAPNPKEEPVKEELDTNKIERAIARGKGSIVTIVSRGAKTAVCKCGEASFDEKTGNLIMKIFPEVEQDGKRISANERGTNITLDKAGMLNADGPVKTVLVTPSSDSKPKTPPAEPKPSTPPANSAAKPR